MVEVSDVVRNVVVSGGGTGIGRGVAEHFAQAGDRVFILGRRQELLEKAAAEMGAVAVRCNAADPVDVESALQALPDRIDVLVNAAGSNMATRLPAPEGLVDIAHAWVSQFEANVVVAVLVTEALLPRMGAGSRIVNFSSNAARTGGPNSYGYGAVKAAVESWTRALAHEVGHRDITANGVAPGITDGTDFFPTPLADDRRQSLLNRAANRRAASIGDIVDAVAYLASPTAGHVTGHVLPVDGGVLFTK